MDNLVAGDIRLCQDFYAVRMCSGTGDINTIDMGAGVTGIDAARIEHSIHNDVICKSTSAVDLLRCVDTLGVLVHVQSLWSRRNLLFLTEELRSHEDSILNFLIASAAAEVAANCLLYVRTRWVQIHIQQAFRRNNHTRDAEAALHSTRLSKAVFVDFHLISRNSFDRENVFSYQLTQRYNTSFCFFAIYQHGASTASSLAAAIFGCGQTQIVSQKRQQLFILLSGILLAVDQKFIHKSVLLFAFRSGRS